MQGNDLGNSGAADLGGAEISEIDAANDSRRGEDVAWISTKSTPG